MKPLVVFGTGAHARKAFHAARSAGWDVVGFADEQAGAVAPVPGLPVLEAVPEGAAVFVAIGRAEVRQRLTEAFAARCADLPAIAHARACVAPDALLEAGVLVAAGAVVESGARIGRGAIVDIGALVDHDAQVAPYAHVRPGQVLGPRERWPA